MSLRLRLALAFVLLSALPLAGLAFYSYRSSGAALRRAAQAEAEGLARDLARRVGSATAAVDRDFRTLARLPLEAWNSAEPAESSELAEPNDPSEPNEPDDPDRPRRDRPLEAALAGLGPTLRFLEGVSFVPTPPAPPVAAVAPTPSVAASAPVASMPALAPLAPMAPMAPVAPTAPPWPPTADHAGREAELGRAAAERGAREAERAAAAMQRESIRHELEQAREMVRRVLVEKRTIEEADVSADVLESVLGRKREALVRLESLERSMASGDAAAPGDSPTHAAPERGDTDAGSGASGAIDGSVSCPVEAGDQIVGRLHAKVKAKELLRSVLEQTDRERGEIPFALDPDSQLYVAESADAERLESLPAIAALRARDPSDRREPSDPSRSDAEPRTGDDWVVVTREEPTSGYRYGIARPLSSAMAELKAATARNFTFGMALVGLALVGMVPVSRRLVRDVHRLEEGAARLADGDLSARVPVDSGDELGRLAGAFNRMAEQLAENQDRLLAEERRRKEEEISRRLLAAENERRRRELEEAREFQLSLLPRELPRRAGLDLAVSMTTATEVGGDYYDFLDAADGGLVVAVGDATGHGAAAGTMVTAIKGLFAGRAAESRPAAFLVAANAAVHRMGLVRRAMALTVARVEGRRVTLSAAGMPPVLHMRAASGRVAEVALVGTPLGARAECPYAEATVELAPGDALLFLSDGLPELPNPAGEPYGYERLAQRFAALASASASASGIVAGLEATAADWNGRRAPADDVTFLVMKAS